MEASGDIKDRLSRLRIEKGQRPTATVVTGRSRRVWPWLFVGLLAAAGGVYYFRDHLPDAVAPASANQPEVRLITVEMRRDSGAPPVLTATGKIVSDHRVNVATKVSGQITDLNFEQGDHVEAGQIIATLEIAPHEARRDNAAALLAQSRARLEYARVNYDRTRRLYEEHNAPEIEFANMKSLFEAAESDVHANEAALREAQWRLDECAVKAPITGVVLERNVEIGDFVAAEGGFGGMANSQFASIADMTMLRVEVDISELDIGKIHKDQPCRITPDAYKDRRYAGHVMWIDPGANYSKATVQVKVRIENPDPQLRVEGSARVDFLIEPDKDEADAKPTIWLSSSAIRPVEGRPDEGTVFEYSEGRLKERRIKLGRTSDRQVEILSGLSAGDQVAAVADSSVHDGDRVRPAGTP